MGRKKEFPKFCDCEYCTSSDNPFWARDSNAKKNHKSKLIKLTNMPPKRANSTMSTTNEVGVGQKRKHSSPQLDLFLANCKPGGSLVTAQNGSNSFFNESMDNALSVLSFEDKIALKELALKESSSWMITKKKYQENFDSVIVSLGDAVEWVDYAQDLTFMIKHNNVILGYKTPGEELDSEITRLGNLLQVAINEKDRREKESQERINEAIITKVDKKVLHCERGVVSTHSSRNLSDNRDDDDRAWANLDNATNLDDVATALASINQSSSSSSSMP